MSPQKDFAPDALRVQVGTETVAPQTILRLAHVTG